MAGLDEYSCDRKGDGSFSLLTHQNIVRDYINLLTPYRGLLLYHGLGSGKTCSAISVAEEMREYNKQMGIGKRIIVVASPNVQENFKVQLFDELLYSVVLNHSVGSTKCNFDNAANRF